MVLLLGTLSVIIAIVAFPFLSEATLGVGIIGYACWFGIMCRLAQADEHNKQKKKRSAAED